MSAEPADRLAATVSALLGEPVRARQRVRGGDVAEAFRVVLAGGRTVFAKTHRAAPPGFFTTEAAGLAWLREAGALPVPDVLAVTDGDDSDDGDGGGDGAAGAAGGAAGRRGGGHGDGMVLPALVLEWIDEHHPATPDEEQFGRALAGLHAAGAATFGREDRRTTGSRRLPNEPCATWAEFYATQRLGPLARLVREAGHLGNAARRLAAGLDAVAARAEELSGPAEPPARLHGDLWAGNRIVDRHGRSWLIDPACFGGHREFDLAMMRLFGGFGDRAFAAYAEAAPLADGWRQRVAFHQLAPLAVHAVKFGGAYGPALGRALRQLGG